MIKYITIVLAIMFGLLIWPIEDSQATMLWQDGFEDYSGSGQNFFWDKDAETGLKIWQHTLDGTVAAYYEASQAYVQEGSYSLKFYAVRDATWRCGAHLMTMPLVLDTRTPYPLEWN